MFQKAAGRLFAPGQLDSLVKVLYVMPNEEVEEMERKEKEIREKLEEEKKIERILANANNHKEGVSEKGSPVEETKVERQGRQVIEK